LSTQVPLPFLVMAVAPLPMVLLAPAILTASPMAAARVFVPVLFPCSVRVRFPVFRKPIAPGLVKFRGAEPDASRAVGFVLIVKRRSVLDPFPTHCSVPPLRRRLAAAAPAAPRAPAPPRPERAAAPAV